MAEPEALPQTQTDQVEQEKLKYLDFVHVAVVYVIVWFSGVYEYTKEKAGPLKPGVCVVEGTVKSVIGPVYEKLHDIPLELLKFVDHKMDEVLKEMDNHVPTLMRQITTHAFTVARTGVVDTGTNLAKNVYAKYEPIAKKLYTKYEPIAERHVVFAWRSLNGVPLFRQVAGIAVPTGVYCAEKYNHTVCYVAEKGFKVAGYMPLVPVAKIGKIFQGDVSMNGE